MTKKQKQEIAKFVIMGKELRPQASEVELIAHFASQEKCKVSINDMVDIFGLVRQMQKTTKLKKTTRKVGNQTYTFVEIDD